MAIPLWDDVQLPPDYTLKDINGIVDEDERQNMQAQALDLWEAETGLSFEDLPREWDPDEGMFIIIDGNGVTVGIQLILEADDA